MPVHVFEAAFDVEQPGRRTPQLIRPKLDLWWFGIPACAWIVMPLLEALQIALWSQCV